MKQKLEKAAREYAESAIDSFGRGGVPSGISDIKEMIALGFENGSEWQAKQSPWINVNERLPDNDDDLYFMLDTKLEPPACGVGDFDLDMHKWVGAGGIILHPTHWMPIPKLNS